MKTRYNAVADAMGPREKSELREVGRMHMVAFQEIMTGRTLKPKAVGFATPGATPGEDPLLVRRGYLFLNYSSSEQMRFYVSPGAAPGRYIADKIYFVYTAEHGGAIMLELTADQWANDIYDALERTGAVNDHIAQGQTENAN